MPGDYLRQFERISGISSSTGETDLADTDFVKDRKHCAASLWHMFCHAQQKLQENPSDMEMLQLANSLAHEQFNIGSAYDGRTHRLGTARYLQELRTGRLKNGQWLQATPKLGLSNINYRTYKHRFEIINTSLSLWKDCITLKWMEQTETTTISIDDAAIAWAAFRLAQATFDDPKGRKRQVLLTRIPGDKKTPSQLFTFTKDLRTWRDSVRHPKGKTFETLIEELRALIISTRTSDVLQHFNHYKRRFLRYRQALEPLLENTSTVFASSPGSLDVSSKPTSPTTPGADAGLPSKLISQLNHIQRFLTQFRRWKHVGEIMNIAPSVYDKLLGSMACNTLPGLSQAALDWMRSTLTETFVLPNKEAGIDSAYNYYQELEKYGWIENIRSFYIFSITSQILSTPDPDENALAFINHHAPSLSQDTHPLTKKIYKQPWLMLCFQQSRYNAETIDRILDYLHTNKIAQWKGELDLNRTLKSLATHISLCAEELEQQAIALYKVIYRFIEDKTIVLTNGADHPFWHVRTLKKNTTNPHKKELLVQQLQPCILSHLRSTFTSTDLNNTKSIPLHPTRYILFHYEYSAARQFFFERDVQPEILLAIVELGMSLAVLISRDTNHKVVHQHSGFVGIDSRLTKEAFNRIKGQHNADGELYLDTNMMHQYLLVRIASVYKTSKVLRLDDQQSRPSQQHQADYKAQITMAYIQFASFLEHNPLDTLIYEVVSCAMGYALWDLFYLMTNKLWESGKKSWPKLFVRKGKSKQSGFTPTITPRIPGEKQATLGLPNEFITMTQILTNIIYLERVERNIAELNAKIEKERQKDEKQTAATNTRKARKKKQRSRKKKKKLKTPEMQLDQAQENLVKVQAAISDQHGMLRVASSMALPLGAGPLVIPIWTQFPESRQAAVKLQTRLNAQVAATAAPDNSARFMHNGPKQNDQRRTAPNSHSSKICSRC